MNRIFYSENIVTRPKNLYKYLNYDGAISMLRNETIKFAYPGHWTKADPYENIVVSGKFVIGDTTQIPFPLADNVYLTCFTEQYSCEAQWTVYKKEGDETYIEIQFNVQKLVDLIKRTGVMFALGKMNYVNSNDFNNAVSECFATQIAKKALQNYSKHPTKNNFKYVIKPLFVKRAPYKYENEWRLIMAGKNVHSGDYCVEIPNLLDAIELIIIGPYANDKCEQIKSEITEILKQKGRNITIRKSKLFRERKKITTFKLK